MVYHVHPHNQPRKGYADCCIGRNDLHYDHLSKNSFGASVFQATYSGTVKKDEYNPDRILDGAIHVLQQHKADAAKLLLIHAQLKQAELLSSVHIPDDLVIPDYSQEGK